MGNYGMTCSRAYTVCRNDILDEGRWARDGCKKKCKDTKAMTALKSCKKNYRMIWCWLSGYFGLYTFKHTKLTLCSTKTPPNSALILTFRLSPYFHLIIPWIYYLFTLYCLNIY